MITVKENGMVDARELHSFLEVKNYFADWFEDMRDYADLKEQKDFYGISRQSTGGRPRKDYDLTIDSAKEICMLAKNQKGKELRRWLIQLSNKVEENDLLTHEQVIFLSKLKVVFSYISECKKSEQLHLNKHVQESNAKNPYAEFHVMRNEILGIDPTTIDERIKLYCIENQRLLPKNCSKTEKLIILDKYEVLRNGVWDYLRATESTQSIKLANLVKEMAMVEQIAMNRVNESNLINSKINLPILK